MTNKMNERTAITKFIAPWVRARKDVYGNMLVEAKYARYGYINDDSFEPQQIVALRSGVSHKIADGVGSIKPVDIFAIQNANSFIATVYPVGEKYGLAVIDIDSWDKRDEKNVTWDVAKKIGKHWYILEKE